MIVKALSLTQPWANMIAQGTKTIETRPWATAHRGPLLICATRGPRTVCSRCPHHTTDGWFVTTLQQNRIGCREDCFAPYGQAVALATLAHVRPMVAEDRYAAGCELYPRAQAWELVDVLAISPEERFDVRGLPSLFGVVVHDDSDLGLEIARRLGMGFDGNTMEA